MKKLLFSLLAVLVSTFAFADELYQSISFPMTEQVKVSAYSCYWTAKTEDGKWSFKNFNNNNNGWNYIKCGWKTATTTSVICSPVIEAALDKVEISVGATSGVTSAKFNVLDKDSTVLSSQQVTLAKGDVQISISQPKSDCRYQLIIENEKVSSNGTTQINGMTLYCVPDKVKKPTFSLKSGTYCGPQKVTIDCATEGASIIYYFGDDEKDFTEYTEYGQEIEIKESCTLHAIASYQGETSKIASATYVIVPFLATDGNNRIITDKYPTSPLTVKYGNYADGITVKVNGKEVTYDPAKGISFTKTSLKNENDTISVYNGDKLVAERIYTWVPTVNVSSYKNLEDGTEAVLTFNNGNKVTYVSSDNKTVFFEDASKGIEGYDLGLKFTAYKTISKGAIWGKKATYNGIAEITKTDSTATYSSVTQTTTDVTPTSLTVAQTLLDNNQLRYAKIFGAQIIVKNNKYYAVCANDTVQLYDQLKTKVLTSLTKTPCFADVYGIVARYKETIEVYPITLENVGDSVKGVSGTVSWAIDMDGNMTFYPTDGVSGTLASTAIRPATRSWSSVASLVKNVKFDEGVNSNTDISYMFYQMYNLEEIDFTNFNTTAAKKMKGIFSSDSILITADLSELDLSNITDMALAFNGCVTLEDINFGNFDAAKLTTMESAFYNCISLQNLYLDKFAPTALTNISTAFFGCKSIQTLDLRQLSTASIIKSDNMGKVFGEKTDKTDAACIPSTLVLSSNFGKTDAGYITLPTATYADPEGNQYTLPADQEKLYTYSMANKAGYTEFDQVLNPTTKIETVSTVNSLDAVRYNLAGQRVNANAKGIVIMNGKKMLVK